MAGTRVGRRSARPTLGRRVATCGKVRYRTELDAKMALANRVWKDKGEVRAYRHSRCGGWHLTSQPTGSWVSAEHQRSAGDRLGSSDA